MGGLPGPGASAHLLLHVPEALSYSLLQIGGAGLQDGFLYQVLDNLSIIGPFLQQHHVGEASFAITPKAFDGVVLW